MRSASPEFNTYHCQAHRISVDKSYARPPGPQPALDAASVSRRVSPSRVGDVVIAGRIPLHSTYRRVIKMQLTQKLI